MKVEFLILSHRPDLLKRMDGQIQTRQDITYSAWYNGEEKITQEELKNIKLVIVSPSKIRNKRKELLLYKARVQSIKECRKDSDIVCLLDDDAQFFDGYLNDADKVIEYFEKNEDIGLITTQPDDRDMNGVIYNIRPLYPEDCMTAGVHSGMFIRKSVLENVNFDEFIDIAGGGEDSLIASILFNKCYAFNIGRAEPKIFHPVGKNPQELFKANESIDVFLQEEFKPKFRFSNKNINKYCNEEMSPYNIPNGGIVSSIIVK